MIIDKLSNSQIYATLNPRLQAGFEFLKNQDLAALEVGKHPIDGEQVFALVQHYNTKPVEEGKLETHRKCLDLQYVVSGRELMGWAPISGLQPLGSYSPENDIQFFAGQGNLILFEAGMFAIFFPEDAHMPGIAFEGPEPVKKIVIKVAI